MKNKLIIDSLVLILSILAIVFFWENTLTTVIILLVLSVCILIKTTKKEILFFIIIATLATLVESFTIFSGAWVYSSQQLILVPIWLPLYWGIGGLIIKDIYLFLKKPK